MASPARKPKSTSPLMLDLALQGGGAHGAFTWGVLDRLLEAPDMRFGAISGASAGAMNAVVLASGLMTGGAAGARKGLASFWSAINQSARDSVPVFSLLETIPGWTAGASWLVSAMGAGRMTLTSSPASGAPVQRLLGEVIAAHVDFDALREPDAPRLFISATNAHSGTAKMFTNEALSVDVLLASACLPQMFPAVKIDDVPYWDGGFSANPPITPLIHDSQNNDLLLVNINPRVRDALPYSQSDITERMSELTFNQSLLKELRAIAMLKAEFGDDPTTCAMPFARAIAELRFHEIHNDEKMGDLDPTTKMFPTWGLLSRLRDVGRETADTWLAAHGGKLGKSSSAKLNARFEEDFAL